MLLLNQIFYFCQSCGYFLDYYKQRIHIIAYPIDEDFLNNIKHIGCVICEGKSKQDNFRWIGQLPGYYVDKQGIIYSTRTNKIIKTQIDTRGYKSFWPYVNGKRKKIRVHRLVATTYLGLPDQNNVVRHLNGNKLDNRLENLTWGTQAENVSDYLKHKKLLKQAKT